MEQINGTGQLQEGYVFSCVDMVKKDDKIWFSAREINGLYSVREDGTGLEYHGSFPNEPEWQTYLHGTCILYGEKIIFTPYYAGRIGMYDISQNEFQELIPENNICLSGYLSAVLYKSYLILLPEQKSNDVIVKIDLEKKNVKCIKNWEKEFELDSQEGMLFREYCIVDDKIYAPIISAYGQIMEYDLRTDSVSSVQVGDKQQYQAICYDGKDFYLCMQRGNILVRWNRELGKKQQYIIDGQEETMIMSCIYKNGRVFLFTMNGGRSKLQDKIISVDIESGRVEKVLQTDRKHEINLWPGKFGSVFAVLEEKEKLFIFNCGNGSLYELNTISMQLKEYEIEKTDIGELYREKFRNLKDNIYFENRMVMQDLSPFLEMEKPEDGVNSQVSAGDAIWNTLKP